MRITELLDQDRESRWLRTATVEPAQVLDELRSAEKLIVVTHENPDGDALGSLIAMQGILDALARTA